MWDNVEKYSRARQVTDDNIIRRMRFKCRIMKATDTHSEHVILIAFLLQYCLHERASMLRLYSYVHCLACCCYPAVYCRAVGNTNTGCNRRKGPDFGRVFLRSNYTDITQNTYIQSWMVTEILAREKSGLLWCLRTVLVSLTSFSPLLELHSYVRANVAPATLATGGAFSSV